MMRVREGLLWGVIGYTWSPHYWGFGVFFSTVGLEFGVNIGPLDIWTSKWMWDER